MSPLTTGLAIWISATCILKNNKKALRELGAFLVSDNVLFFHEMNDTAAELVAEFDLDTLVHQETASH